MARVCKPVKVLLAFLFIAIFFAVPAHAETVDYNVNISTVLNISVSANSVVLDLNPNNKTFDSKDLTVTVSTNSSTGYSLSMSSTGTDLVRDNSTDGINATISTLPSLAGGYTESSFVANKWGYKIGNGNYLPFVSGAPIASNDTATNARSTTLSFASKISNDQLPGSYSTTLSFTAVANPAVQYMQDFTKSMCQELASSDSYIVYDKRDSNDYTVRYINGNCWMTQNLRFTGTSLNSTTSNVAGTYTTSNPLTIQWGDLDDGDDYTQARYHTSNDTAYGVWYNYSGASATSIVGSGNNTTTAEQSICPAGWRLPTKTEQGGIVSNISEYSPVGGGYYRNKVLDYAAYGFWWASTAVDGTQRDVLRAYNGSMATTAGVRQRILGFYVRCIRSS